MGDSVLLVLCSVLSLLLGVGLIDLKMSRSESRSELGATILLGTSSSSLSSSPKSSSRWSSLPASSSLELNSLRVLLGTNWKSSAGGRVLVAVTILAML